MKVVLQLIVLFPLLAAGQNSIVSTPNTNVLYRGMNNPVRCAVVGVPCITLMLTSLNQNIHITGSGCNYFVQTWNPGPVKFIIQSRTDNTVLDTFSLAVCDVPDPTARFHTGRFNEFFSDFIIVSNPVWENFNVPFKVIEFDLYFYHENKELSYVTNTGATFTDETLKKIGQLRREDELIIRRIVLDVDGQTLSYNVYERYIIN